jgi:hypothetical protein
MGAKVRADRRSQHSEPLVAVEPVSADVAVGGAGPASALEPPEIEADVRATSVWFEALPPELQRYFDHEARHGRGAYRFVVGGAAPEPPLIAGGSADAAPASTPKPAAT